MKVNEYGQPVIANKVDFAEVMREVHLVIAISENSDLSGGNAYKVTKACFLAAIAISYPESDAERIYDLWVDNGETVAHCVEADKKHKLDNARSAVINTIQEMHNSEQDVLYGPM
jgi:hypothetical protein